MSDEPMTLGQMILAEESRMIAKARIEIAAEEAAWRALSDEERAVRIAEAEARWDAFSAACGEAENDNEEEDE